MDEVDRVPGTVVLIRYSAKFGLVRNPPLAKIVRPIRRPYAIGNVGSRSSTHLEGRPWRVLPEIGSVWAG